MGWHIRTRFLQSTRRNLGAMLVMFKHHEEAVAHLRKALELMPDDPQTIFGLASALECVGTDAADLEADALHARFIAEHPESPMVEQSEKYRTAFASNRLKSDSPDGFRRDVMQYVADALTTFKKVGPAKREEIALEIAVLGQAGLDINDPVTKYKLKSIPGRFSGLHLVSIMYAAFRQMDPTIDAGVDFSDEYEAALKLSRD